MTEPLQGTQGVAPCLPGERLGVALGLVGLHRVVVGIHGPVVEPVARLVPELAGRGLPGRRLQPFGMSALIIAKCQIVCYGKKGVRPRRRWPWRLNRCARILAEGRPS
jgi:hypothetical protein